MKHYKIAGATLGLFLCSCGQPEQKFEITVVDDGGKPIAGVECKAWFQKPDSEQSSKHYFILAESDAGGKASLQGRTLWAPTSVEAKKEGFYSANAGEFWTRKRNGNRWEPWPVRVDLVMKKIVRPHPMYVAMFDGQKWLSFPEKRLGPFGFDLKEGDWVHPHGKGKVSDFILKGERDNNIDEGPMPRGRVFLTFSNPNDGILQLNDPGGSSLVGPCEAIADDAYQNTWIFENAKTHPEDDSRLSRDFKGEVFVFRVQTQLDEAGKIKSARYGKLDGRIVGWLPQRVPSVLMTYYFNDASNERNLEWDGKTNLLPETEKFRIPERH